MPGQIEIVGVIELEIPKDVMARSSEVGRVGKCRTIRLKLCHKRVSGSFERRRQGVCAGWEVD